MDFTISTYAKFLKSFLHRDYTFYRFDTYVSLKENNQFNKLIMLRHDVDLLPEISLKTARLEHELGISGTYYFRIVPESFNPKIMEEIASLGHEVGYHYEDVDLVARGVGHGAWGRVRDLRGTKRNESIGVSECRCNGELESRYTEDLRKDIVSDTPVHRHTDTVKKEPTESLTPNIRSRTTDPDLIDRAMESFLKNLETMRMIADIKTICMHGSPMSPYDNRLLWTKYDYRDYGLIGEPYFDVDFSEVGYYTDTGRRWDGDRVSVRDKVSSRKYVVGSSSYRCIGVSEYRSEKKSRKQQLKTGNRQPATLNQHPAPGTQHPVPSTQQPAPSTNIPRFRKTSEIIAAIENGSFPDMAMITVHPQRWHDRTIPWMRELFLQNIKNIVKRIVVMRQKRWDGVSG